MYNFIDLEASGLGVGSYPIEVGVALENGGTNCTLICPPHEWKHWDASAEALHGISRQTLLLNGRSPLKVAMLLNEWLAGEVVYSDAWGNDACWLARLFDEAGVMQRFRVDSIVSILAPEQLDLWAYAKEQAERNLFLKRHRASNDALILQLTHALLQEGDLSYKELVERAELQLRSQDLGSAGERAEKVVNLQAVRAIHQDVQARQIGRDLSLEHKLGKVSDDQLLDLLEKKQLQY